MSKHLDVIPLGGLGEIGKNMMCFRYDDEIIVVDGGLAFPDSNQPGIDLIIPKIDYLIETTLVDCHIFCHACPKCLFTAQN
jgi:ribonuclease J